MSSLPKAGIKFKAVEKNLLKNFRNRYRSFYAIVIIDFYQLLALFLVV